LSRPRSRRIGPAYHASLLANGFVLRGERVEFKSPVENLAIDDGTPLEWRDLDEVGLDAVAAVLAETAEGDPHGHSERDRPRDELTEWLADPVLTDGPECVQIGFENDRAVAFICAQVWPKNGWSRIAYMGVTPDARGRGLGRWVHRHGFRMIRDQGGTLYHGGTATDNEAMIRLFTGHGCEESERMLEFEWRAGPSAGGSST
jgi:GNAT superfamily N-acetyltransferase